jgi:hypothetical protein
MEEKEKKKRKRVRKAYLIEDGVRKELVVPKAEKLSNLAIWVREHPNFGEILDMRAVMK